MFLGEIFVSTEVLLSIMLLLFDFSVCLVYAMHLILPKPLRVNYVRLEELSVPSLKQVLAESACTPKKRKRKRK